QESERVIKAALNAGDKAIPKDLLQRASCIGVFPDLKKTAFIAAGGLASGVFSCRQEDGTMGPPAFFSIAGGSSGWRWDGKEADLVLLILNEEGVKHLLRESLTIGVDVPAAAGPVGPSAGAAADAQTNAQILSWSHSRGAFLGV